jgi:Uma2 family endonuclease
MSMTTSTSPTALPGDPTASQPFLTAQGDQRIVIRGVDRDLYDRLSQAIGEDQHIRLAYDGKDLELLTTGNVHEHFKELLGRIIQALAIALDIDFVGCGETTWDAEGTDRALQADLSYYFDAEKVRAGRDALDRQSKEPADYPAPDLAIEIDISSPKVDRSGIYTALGVPEIWRFNGKGLVIEQLQPEGAYKSVDGSRFFPIVASDIRRWLVEESTKSPAWDRRLLRWAQELVHAP